jgi:O-succinylbenzoate synthase
VAEVSDEHLLDITVPVLVAAGDLAAAPRCHGGPDALLDELAGHRIAQQPVARPSTDAHRRPLPR